MTQSPRFALPYGLSPLGDRGAVLASVAARELGGSAASSHGGGAGRWRVSADILSGVSVLATRKRTYTVRALLRDAVAVGARLDRVLAIWMGQRVPAPLREQLMVAVARANACGTCIWVHGAWARWTGVSEARLRALADDDEDAFDVRTWVALQYVRALVESDGGPVAPALLAQTEARFGPEGARDLETITRVMTLANRTNNTVDAFVARLRGRPSTGSRWFDEVLVALMAAIASVPTRVGLSLARRGPKGARPLARRAGRP